MDPEKREQVFYQVIGDLGPPDGTIIIHCVDAQDRDEIYDDNLTMAILQELSQIGEVILVRFVMETMWVTFRDGQCALTAAAKKSAQILGYNFTISLKTPNWVNQVKEEISLCSNNTLPLYATQPEYNCLGIPEVGRNHRNVPPSRPPPPAVRSPATPKKIPAKVYINYCNSVF